jgi:hypothetical protein
LSATEKALVEAAAIKSSTTQADIARRATIEYSRALLTVPEQEAPREEDQP